MPRPTEDVAQVYSFRGPRLTLGPAEVSGSCLFPFMSQINAQTYTGPGSGLLPLRSQIHAWPCRDLWFLSPPSEVPDLHPDWQRSWLRPSSWEVLDSRPDPQGSWLRSTPLKVPDSHLDPQWSLALAHLFSSCSFVPVPVEIAVSGLLWLSPGLQKSDVLLLKLLLVVWEQQYL